MPVQIPLNEKNNFIALVEVAPYPGGAMEADRLRSILVYYDDIVTAIYRQLDLFAANSAYLTQGLDCFDNAQMQAVGIWFNYTTSSPPLTDPVLIANSTIHNDIIISADSPPVYTTLAIIGNSFVDRVLLSSGASLNELYIGPGSTVDKLNAAATSAIVNTIWLPFAKSTPSKLNVAEYNSIVGQFVIEEGSYFGGFSNKDPESSCATPVTDLTYGIINHDTIQITWTPPDMQSPPYAYLFINTYYRLKGSQVWLKADEAVGFFNGESGFTFKRLKCDTTYEFRVAVTCNNGGVANSDVLTIATTGC